MSRSISAALFLILSISCVCGCGKEQAVNDSRDSSSASDDHGHDHGEHGHHDVEGHAHGPGPHGGTIADWGGGKFHVEFTVDHDKKEAIVYVLGTDEKTPVTIDAKEITLSIKDPAFSTELVAKPLDSELLGGSSRFVGTHDGLGVVKEYEGSISGVVDGTPYSGKFVEE